MNKKKCLEIGIGELNQEKWIDLLLNLELSDKELEDLEAAAFCLMVLRGSEDMKSKAVS